MSEHSVPQVPTVDEIAEEIRKVALPAWTDMAVEAVSALYAPVLAELERLRAAVADALVALHYLDATPLHEAGIRAAHVDTARDVLAAVNNDPAGAPVPVSSDQSSVTGPDAPRWTRREIVDLIHEGLPIIEAYDTTIEAPRRFAEDIVADLERGPGLAALLARGVDAAVNSDQADTAVSTDRDENVNSDRSAMPIGPERERLIEVVAQLRDELALIATRQTPTSDYEGFGEFEDELTGWADGWARSLATATDDAGWSRPALTSEYRVHWRWPSGHTHINSTPLLDEVRTWVSSLGGEVVRVEVRETTPWRDLDEAPASALADTETTKGDDDA